MCVCACALASFTHTHTRAPSKPTNQRTAHDGKRFNCLGPAWMELQTAYLRSWDCQSETIIRIVIFRWHPRRGELAEQHLLSWMTEARLMVANLLVLLLHEFNTHTVRFNAIPYPTSHITNWRIMMTTLICNTFVLSKENHGSTNVVNRQNEGRGGAGYSRMRLDSGRQASAVGRGSCSAQSVASGSAAQPHHPRCRCAKRR